MCMVKNKFTEYVRFMCLPRGLLPDLLLYAIFRLCVLWEQDMVMLSLFFFFCSVFLNVYVARS